MNRSFLYKAELIALYGTHYRAFDAMIAEIKPVIGWKEGRQRFNPKQIRVIFEHLGPPLSQDELVSK